MRACRVSSARAQRRARDAVEPRRRVGQGDLVWAPFLHSSPLPPFYAQCSARAFQVTCRRACARHPHLLCEAHAIPKPGEACLKTRRARRRRRYTSTKNTPKHVLFHCRSASSSKRQNRQDTIQDLLSAHPTVCSDKNSENILQRVNWPEGSRPVFDTSANTRVRAAAGNALNALARCEKCTIRRSNRVCSACAARAKVEKWKMEKVGSKRTFSAGVRVCGSPKPRSHAVTHGATSRHSRVVTQSYFSSA